MAALSPSSNTITYHHQKQQPCPVSPPQPPCSQVSQGTRHQQPLQSPPTTASSYVSFSQAQSYFAQQHTRPPATLPSSQLPQTQAQTQSIPTNPSAPGLAVGVVRNISKPKFNYAFLDTKRPRGPSSRWSPNEDELLKAAVREFGEERQWVKVAQSVPGRTNLQCRQRWLCNIRAQVVKERLLNQA
ncbi:myb-like DNA-binding protein bas1 [Coemansia aciculifera]|nr:myb-like DNA-binding protein bas1 [Coemansia aciculifera]